MVFSSTPMTTRRFAWMSPIGVPAGICPGVGNGPSGAKLGVGSASLHPGSLGAAVVGVVAAADEIAALTSSMDCFDAASLVDAQPAVVNARSAATVALSRTV